MSYNFKSTEQRKREKDAARRAVEVYHGLNVIALIGGMVFGLIAGYVFFFHLLPMLLGG